MATHPIFHPGFKTMPYWWEAYRPTAQDPLDVPKQARVAIVGGGYAGLSTALELARHGIDSVVLEAAELGFGASTRNGGGVSGGVNIGKSFTGRRTPMTPERSDALLSDAADAFGLIERLIAEEGIQCHWQKRGRFQGAWTPKHYAAQAARVDKLTWSRANASARKWPATTITAAWWWNAPPACIRPCITRACWTPAAGAACRSAPAPR